VQIAAIHAEIPEVNSYELAFQEAEAARSFQFAAGQFNMLYLPGFGEAAISISSDPFDAACLLHTVRAVGNVTRALARLSVGDSLFLRGPFGSSWPLEHYVGHDLVIVAGGLGLAPLRPAIHYVCHRRDQFGRVWVLYGARKPSDLLYTGQYDAWRDKNLDVKVTTDLGDSSWTGSIGTVTTLMHRLDVDPQRTCLLTCGPEIMMRFVILEGMSLRIPHERMYVSLERNMNCALGFCGRCQLGPAFVCKDGPVFRYDLMEPYLHVEDF
jgi:NAD(P)H-flavin reductase